MYCFILNLLSKTNNKFTKVFNNCRKAGEKIDNHSKSLSQREALADAVVRTKSSSMIYRHLVQAAELESKYWREVFRHIADVIVFLSTRGLASRGHDEIIGSFHNENLLGIIELCSNYAQFLATHIKKYGNKGHGSTIIFVRQCL